MRVLLQRVSQASVTVADETIATIGPGVLLLVGFGRANPAPDLTAAAGKIANLRIFADAGGRFQFSLADIGGAILAVPQFTLYGELRKGRRPDFGAALDPALAEPLFRQFVTALADCGAGPVASGRFGADMQVALVNTGPVSLWLEF